MSPALLLTISGAMCTLLAPLFSRRGALVALALATCGDLVVVTVLETQRAVVERSGSLFTTPSVAWIHIPAAVLGLLATILALVALWRNWPWWVASTALAIAARGVALATALAMTA